MSNPMHVSHRWWWLAMIASVGLMAPRAYAQDPDVRSLTPVVMLVLDTSGSMEGMPGCSCPSDPNSNLCDECYPDCAAGEKNRWALAVEALSGTFDNFECRQIDRDDPAFTYDRGYLAPHHALPPPVTPCTLLGSECQTGILGLLGLGVCLPLLGQCDGGSDQNDDGVLDAYRNEVRFGLLTFDTTPAYGGVSLIPDYEFNDARSEGADGMFSFGGPQDFTYPNCANTYRMDTGVRSESATEGRLISAGTDSSVWTTINDNIQSALLQIRPSGGTPIAASLADLDYYFRNHPDMTSDAYSACRGRFGVLITDGKPDPDFRQFGCDQPGFQCPYALPEDQAGMLRCGPTDPDCSGGGSGMIEKLFVIGLDVTDPDARSQLNIIAERGGNTADMAGDYALFASDAATITASLASILDATQTYPISRTTPLVVRAKSGISYRLSAAFERGGAGLPWSGLLERQQLACGTEPDPTLTDEGRFHVQLNGQGNTRRLFTSLPTASGFTANDSFGSSDGCSGACPNVCFDSPAGPVCSGGVTPANTGSADAAAFSTLADWVHARPGTPRENIRLGAIYHSSPVFVNAPRFDTADASFNEFRFSTGVANRPEVVYTGSNDGVLHAFLLEADPLTGRPAGFELWGFIPPLLLDKLEASMSAPQVMLDGTPVAKNMYFSREVSDAPSAGQYHTVLVSGMRQGGPGYFALDVTDPERPEFLWQYADPGMGHSYGRPALAQITADFQGAGINALPGISQRAVAILPGGMGTELGGVCDSPRDISSGGGPFFTFSESNDTSTRAGHRARVRCWAPRGRSLYFVDMETGRRINTPRIDGFTAPLIGTPALFNGLEGTVATRAFIADADGIIWRIDFSSTNPAEWDAVPFHDMAWDLNPDQGQPGYEPPVISLDGKGRVVVLFGTGNLDNFENPSAVNRVVSLVEIETNPTNPTPLTMRAGFNWEHQLKPSALVTGPLTLFEGITMLASFRPVTGSADSCDPGQSELHAFDYVASDGVNTNTPPTPRPRLVALGGEFNMDDPPTLAEKLLMGLSVAQRAVCQEAATATALTPAGWSTPATVAAGPPVFEVVSNSATALAPVAGSEIGAERRVIQLIPRSRVLSWAGAAD